MAEPGFLSRWSRLKAQAREAAPAADLAPPPPAAAAGPAPATAQPAPAGPALPTLEDAMRLGPDSDYSAFVARGVDASVRRQALRKLFTDPHFNVIDGLDVYMGDYTRADPMPPAMLASLQQAHAWLRAEPKEDDAAPGQPAAAAATMQDQHEATAPQRAPAREQDEH